MRKKFAAPEMVGGHYVPDNYRSSAEIGGREMYLWEKASGRTIAHEFGHILGLDDTYIEGKPCTPMEGFTDDLMGSCTGQVQWYHMAVLGRAYGSKQ